MPFFIAFLKHYTPCQDNAFLSLHETTNYAFAEITFYNHSHQTRDEISSISALEGASNSSEVVRTRIRVHLTCTLRLRAGCGV